MVDKKNSIEWPEIERRKIETFNTAWLPPVYGEHAKALAENLSVSESMTAFSTLLVLSIATQGQSVQVKEGWIEPTNLFGLLIAERGQKKSQVLRPLIAPIYSAEKQENARRRERISKDKATLCMFRKKREALENQLKKDPESKDIQEKLVAVQSEIDNFHPTRPLQILFDDITAEALAKKLSDNGGLGAIISAEGGGFDVFAGAYNKGTANIDILLKGYTVESVRVARKGQEQDIVLDNPNLCVMYAVQPHVLAKCLENAEFLNRGLIDRFLFAPISEEDRPAKFYTTPVPSSLSDGYANNLERLLSQRGNKRVLSLSSEARSLFADHYESIEQEKQNENGLVRPYMSKLAGKTARIAGVLSVASGEDVASAKTMENAINISKWALDNARHVLRQATTEQRQADYIISRMQHKGTRSCTGHDLLKWCTNKGLGLSVARDFDSVKAYMVDHGYLRINKGTGLEYDFNPHLFEQKGKTRC